MNTPPEARHHAPTSALIVALTVIAAAAAVDLTSTIGNAGPAL